MSKTLIRWGSPGALLAAVLALSAALQPAGAAAAVHHPVTAAERRIAYEQRLEEQRHLARERYLAHERALAHERRLSRGRRLQTRLRTERHWYFRHHQLVYSHPGPHHLAPAAKPVAVAHVVAPAPAPAPKPVAKPAPHPAALIRPHRQRLVVKPAAQPVVLQTPQAKTTIDHPMALPLITTQATPAITPAQAAAAPPVDLGTQLGELTTAAAQAMKNARLDLPPALSTGGEGKVVLTLPPELLAAIQAQAATVGLKPSARKVFVTARLAGQGYAVTPNGEQSARVDAGPTIFAWDVKPTGAPGGVLTADMTGSLQGDGDAKTFALGAVTAQIPPPGQPAAAPAPATAPAAAPSQLKLPDLGHWSLGGLKLHSLAIPGHPTVPVPGLGQVASEKVVAAAILVLILILLIAIVRSAAARRERTQRRRRFHNFEAADFGDGHD